MSIDLAEQSFVMIFRTQLLIGLVPKTLGDSFQVDGVKFTSVDDNHLTAFCDRLLDPDDKLAGVQILPLSEAAEELMLAVRSEAYVTSEPGAFQVWFSEAPLDGVRNNGEQAFGGQVYESGAGDLALSIDAESLFTATDQGRLMNAHARWTMISAR